MKKLFALILAVLLVASLVACAPAAPQTTTAPKATQPAGTQPAGTTAPATTEAPVDLLALPMVEPGSVKLTLGIQVNATVLDYEDNYFTKYLEEKTGIDIEFIFFSSNKSEATQQLNLMVAGNEKLPDIIAAGLDQTVIRELGEGGYLYNIAPFFEQGLHVRSKPIMDIMPVMDKAVLWSIITCEDGAIYGWPFADGAGTIDSCHMAGAINKTWAEKFGMDPAEIDTVQELHDYLVKCVNEDPNGNGKKDEMGMLGSMKTRRNGVDLYVMNAYVHLNDQYLLNITDGEVWAPQCTDEYRQGLIELNKWYKEGLISPLSYTIQAHPEQMALIENPDDYIVACWYGHPTLVCSADHPIGLEYAGMKPLQDETGLGGYFPRNATNKIQTTVAISATCEHPELAFRFLDFMNDPYTGKVSRYGEEGVNWIKLDEAESVANGWYDSNGRPAGFRVLKDEWSTETKVNWHGGMGTGMTCKGAYEAGLAWGGTPYLPNPELRGIVSSQVYQYAEEAGEPEEVLKDLGYNTEELEVYDQYFKTYQSFTRNARAEFITGAKDPSDDATWEAYLKELEQNGMNDLIEINQSAYDRMLESVQ